MKKLQNNFTTPEQSKRLLELGVPADSADCYYETFDSHDQNDFRLEVRQNPKELSNSLFNDYPRLIPCWSVGQLIWIYCKVTESIDITIPYQSGMLCEVMVRTFEHKKKYLDFSKLEKLL